MPFGWPTLVRVRGPDALAGVEPMFLPRWQEPNVVAWNEGQHQRRFSVQEVLEDAPERFRFRDLQGRVFELEELTVEGFNQELAPLLGVKPYDSAEKLETDMRNAW